MNPLLPAGHLDAAQIVRTSRSNFRPAFLLLGREQRADIEILYAFCRLADDIADSDGYSREVRRQALAAWRAAFRAPALQGLPGNLRSMMRRRAMAPDLFLELLDGTATDLSPPVRMATRADLDLYCHRVAGAVGLLCLPVFGADLRRCAPYAETLGRALQYTNILRDTASDLARDRIYYPADELAEHGLDAGNFSAEHGRRGQYLGRFATETAALYDTAASLLPPEDSTAMRPAAIMAGIYQALLRKMRRDGLKVMQRRYRLSAAEKIFAFAAAICRCQ